MSAKTPGFAPIGRWLALPGQGESTNDGEDATDKAANDLRFGRLKGLKRAVVVLGFALAMVAAILLGQAVRTSELMIGAARSADKALSCWLQLHRAPLIPDADPGPRCQ